MEKKTESPIKAWDKSWTHISTQRLVTLAMLVALSIVLGRFSIQFTPEIRLSIVGFLPIALAGALMGPMYGAMTGAMGDILNYLLFNHAAGAYFPGYTLTAMLSGWWYGVLLYRHPLEKLSWKRIALCVIPISIVCEIGLNSLWTYLLYSKTFWAKLPLRVLTNAIECPLKMVLLMLMSRAVSRFPKSLLKV